MPGALIREQDQLRQLLISAKRSDQLKNLYDHIVETMDFLVVHYPHDAITKFEEVSYLIKQGDEAAIQRFLKTQELKRYAGHSDHSAQCTKAYLERAQGMTITAKPNVPSDPENQEPEEVAAPLACVIPDLIQENKQLYQWANINLGD